MTPPIALSDHKMMEMAKGCLSDAKQHGGHFAQVPTWLLHLLIEKAERPHD